MSLLRRLGSQRVTRLLLRSAQNFNRSSVSGRSFRENASQSSSRKSSGTLLGLISLGSGLGAAVLLGSPITVAGCENETVSGSNSPDLSNDGRILPKLQIFIGYDPREHDAYEVCRHSILKHATVPLEITPIKQSQLRSSGLYTRSKDPTESTEFSFTRFLTPFLAGFSGWALFVDCDFLYTADVRELIELIDNNFAIMCVQHDYTPKSATKMDGVPQTTYPRKNWSSMVLYNCEHPKNRVLTPAVVNSQTGAFLHRFQWLEDAEIGSIPFTWNFLVGHNEMPCRSDLPKAIHYTSGGPWFEAWKNCEFADLWLREKEDLLIAQQEEQQRGLSQEEKQQQASDGRKEMVVAAVA